MMASKLSGLACTCVAIAFTQSGSANAAPTAAEVDTYLLPYVETNNFSGSVLIQRGDRTLFAKSYGLADRGRGKPNGPVTRFHIASLSILFTSTAVLRLIDQGKLSFDTHVADVVAGVPNGSKITIRNLLEQNSGLPDSNDDLPNYDDLLNSHQTPGSLIAQIRNLPPHSEPGGKSQREEHSGQNLLALIIERKTGLTFAQAMRADVFDPFGMHDSGIDDDGPIPDPMAKGYQVSGTLGLKPAPLIHWSAKTGNGSAYTTAADELKWLRGLVRGGLLSESSRQAMLGTTNGYGWWRQTNARLGQTVYVSNGRAPGFSSRMEYLPDEDLLVIALTNIENEANPTIVHDLAALVIGKPFPAFQYSPVAPEIIGHPTGEFVFGPDFYRSSATLSLVSGPDGVTLNWPGGPAEPLLPIAKDRFMGRYYWTPATIVRDSAGNPVELDYGRFQGTLRTSARGE